ncbi:MAG: orotidine-5'-phosphate decarboxylase [Methanobacteriota archaeon]|jgi:uridine monophosphate synthetase|nr:MAG: orotidine-5'-phosphate decarboxylase [Euryarchaeota archaeon]HIK78431.1 orotidine-5'-phosphate decarboxylase [Candidatus Poseidoniales archaeon]
MELEPSSVWGDRWTSCDSPIAKKYMTVACQKRSIVCLAADRNTLLGLGELIDQVGPYISALKTHVDLVDDWTPEGWAELCDKARQANLLIFEDRKFADIGGITRNQMAGIYDIRSWSDLVTAHFISGPDIVDSLQSAWGDVGRKGGVLLLAQMSSRGNLLNPDYTKTVVDSGKTLKGVFGFIGNGSRPRELEKLREIVGPTKMIWTPGVNLAVGDGNMGQRYGDPCEAVIAGSDTIIVGSGIHRSDNPEQSAKMYAAASWNALLERNNG